MAVEQPIMIVILPPRAQQQKRAGWLYVAQGILITDSIYPVLNIRDYTRNCDCMFGDETS